MNLTPRDTGIVLGAFTFCVIVAAGGYIVVKTRPPVESSAVASVPSDDDASAEARRILDEEALVYSISESGIFNPLVAEATGGLEGGGFTPIAVTTTRVVDVTPATRGGGQDGGPAAGGGPGYAEMSGGGMGGPMGVPKAIDVAITGIVLGRKTVRALVEENSSGESEWVDVPGAAYGYRVRYVTLRGAVLEKDGRTYVLLLGANKKPRASGDYGVPGSGSGPPGGAPSPEDMQKMMETQVQYEGRRPRGGGPPGGWGGGPGYGPPPGAMKMRAPGAGGRRGR